MNHTLIWVGLAVLGLSALLGYIDMNRFGNASGALGLIGAALIVLPSFLEGNKLKKEEEAKKKKDEVRKKEAAEAREEDDIEKKTRRARRKEKTPQVIEAIISLYVAEGKSQAEAKDLAMAGVELLGAERIDISSEVPPERLAQFAKRMLQNKGLE